MAGLLLEWDKVLRRDFLKGAGAATPVSAAGRGVDTAIDGDSQDLLHAHQDLRAVHGRFDNLRGAQAVYRQAADHHQLNKRTGPHNARPPPRLRA